MAKKDKKKDKKAEAAFPGMTPPWDNKDAKKKAKAQAKEFASGMKSFMEKTVEMQKASTDGAKDQYDQVFAYMMGLQDGLAAALPDEIPAILGLPALPVSPKDVAAAVKEFEEMANEYFVKQMDSRVDFFFQTKQKAVDMIPEPPAEEEAAEDEAAEEAPAEEEKAEDEEKAE